MASEQPTYAQLIIAECALVGIRFEQAERHYGYPLWVALYPDGGSSMPFSTLEYCASVALLRWKVMEDIGGTR